MPASLRHLRFAIACAAASSGCVEVVIARPPAISGAMAVRGPVPTAPVEHGRLAFEFRSYDSGACLVISVVPGGAADRAGLRVGDFILAVDGAGVGPPDCTQPLLASRRPGEPVTLRVCRDTTTLDLPARLEADETPLFLHADPPEAGPDPRPACVP